MELSISQLINNLHYWRFFLTNSSWMQITWGLFFLNCWIFFLIWDEGERVTRSCWIGTCRGHLNLLHKTGLAVRSDWVAEAFIQSDPENLWGWKLLSLSEQPVPLLHWAAQASLNRLTVHILLVFFSLMQNRVYPKPFFNFCFLHLCSDWLVIMKTP